jgi:hypothetical protein
MGLEASAIESKPDELIFNFKHEAEEKKTCKKTTHFAPSKLFCAVSSSEPRVSRPLFLCKMDSAA